MKIKSILLKLHNG
uniref:Uncharacterized protein n=1 Tax=Anguilla anguilla TaxID=7936 RepID=A0A0E9UW05_ANGAN